MPIERPFKSRRSATSGATPKVQENDAERRHAANIVVLTIRTQARSGSPRFLWRSRFAETCTRKRVCWRQTTGAKHERRESPRKRCRAAARREHCCLDHKNPSAERLSALPLAFGLCRNEHAGACMLQANNRPETHKAHYGSEGALCRPNDLLKVAERPRAERLRKSKKTSQSKRKAFVNDVVLSIKTPTEDRLSGVPLAFGLCRNKHAGACLLEANNRPEYSYNRREIII